MRSALHPAALIFFIFPDVLQPAVQNFTQLVKRKGADVCVFKQSLQLAGAEMVFLDQPVLGNALFQHGAPKLVVNDHGIISPICVPLIAP